MNALSPQVFPRNGIYSPEGTDARKNAHGEVTPKTLDTHSPGRRSGNGNVDCHPSPVGDNTRNFATVRVCTSRQRKPGNTYFQHRYSQPGDAGRGRNTSIWHNWL